MKTFMYTHKENVVGNLGIGKDRVSFLSQRRLGLISLVLQPDSDFMKTFIYGLGLGAWSWVKNSFVCFVFL